MSRCCAPSATPSPVAWSVGSSGVRCGCAPGCSGSSLPGRSPSGSARTVTTGPIPRATRSVTSAPSTPVARTPPRRRAVNNNPVKQSPDDVSQKKVTSGSTRDFLAVAILFLGNGLVVGTFGGSLPGLRSRLDLGPGQIVGVLVAAGIFAVASMNLSGPLSDRFGARTPSMIGGSTMAAAGVVMGLAPSYPVLVLGAAVFGLGNGAMDVSMNTLGVAVEQARRRPVMSRLHACFSIGGFVGALIVVVLGRLLSDDVTKWSLWTASALMLVLLVGVSPITPQSPRRGSEDGTPGEIPKVAWLLAAMAVCFGL